MNYHGGRKSLLGTLTRYFMRRFMSQAVSLTSLRADAKKVQRKDVICVLFVCVWCGVVCVCACVCVGGVGVGVGVCKRERDIVHVLERQWKSLFAVGA